MLPKLFEGSNVSDPEHDETSRRHSTSAPVVDAPLEPDRGDRNQFTEPDPHVAVPLVDFLPGKVTGAQLRKALDHDLNPFTKLPYTPRYRKILETRKSLPVFAQMDEFLEMFNNNQVIVLTGELGSGKTTQIPQFSVFCNQSRPEGKMVVCTQPRQGATVSIAERAADEMDVQLGLQVDYHTHFEDITEPGTTLLKCMTDDMLLHEAMHDRDFKRYSTIILDEADERSLATDILMSLLKDVVKRRPELKVIVMCRTQEALKLQKFFNNRSDVRAPLLKIPGRAHSVEIFYTQKPEPDYLEAAIRTVLMIHRAEGPGDILLFLNGEEQIDDACRKIKVEADDLRDQDPDSVGPLFCIPLYSSPLLPQQRQHTFNPAPPPAKSGAPPSRKLVVATNIAETSLIDGIVYVVDPGFSKQKVYNPRLRVESFLVSPISKALAHQRASRAGRTKPGKCFRLYTEKDFIRELEEETYPEILRSNLASTLLKLCNLGIKDLTRFDYVDVPAPESLLRALELLNFLGAMDDNGNLTALGTTMAEFPLEPQLTKLLISSPEFKCSNEILTITAMLSVPNVWMRPNNQGREADAARELFIVPESEHLTLLNVYNQYIRNRADKNWASNNFLAGNVLAQAENIRGQFQHIMERLDIDLVSQQDKTKLFLNVRKALVCGFFMQAARKGEANGIYLTIKDHQTAGLHPSCGLRVQPQWVIYNEFILTGRPYIRIVTEVRPEWLLEYAPVYFDLKTFPNGETKRALQNVQAKKIAKTPGRPDVRRTSRKRTRNIHVHEAD